MATKKTPAELREQAAGFRRQAKDAEMKAKKAELEEDATYGKQLRQIAAERGIQLEDIFAFIEKYADTFSKGYQHGEDGSVADNATTDEKTGKNKQKIEKETEDEDDDNNNI